MFKRVEGFALLMLLLATSVFSQQPPSEDEIPLEEGPTVIADEAEVLVIVENSEVVTTLQTDVTKNREDIDANQSANQQGISDNKEDIDANQSANQQGISDNKEDIDANQSANQQGIRQPRGHQLEPAGG